MSSSVANMVTNFESRKTSRADAPLPVSPTTRPTARRYTIACKTEPVTSDVPATVSPSEVATKDKRDLLLSTYRNQIREMDDQSATQGKRIQELELAIAEKEKLLSAQNSDVADLHAAVDQLQLFVDEQLAQQEAGFEDELERRLAEQEQAFREMQHASMVSMHLKRPCRNCGRVPSRPGSAGSASELHGNQTAEEVVPAAIRELNEAVAQCWSLERGEGALNPSPARSRDSSQNPSSRCQSSPSKSLGRDRSSIPLPRSSSDTLSSNTEVVSSASFLTKSARTTSPDFLPQTPEPVVPTPTPISKIPQPQVKRTAVSRIPGPAPVRRANCESAIPKPQGKPRSSLPPRTARVLKQQKENLPNVRGGEWDDETF